MSRKTDAILGSVGYASGSDIVRLDPLYGGSFAYATNPEEWLSAQAYTPRNLFPIVLETPKMFEYLPDSAKWATAWKLYWEKHCRKIEGLKAGLTVEMAEHDFGGSGRKFQEIVDVKRERSTLSTQCIDTYGNVWQEFWGQVILYGGMDPETKLPLTSTLANGPTDNLADNYSGTIAFIEPDATGKKCFRCWVGVNIFPMSNGPVEGNMDRTQALTPKDLSLEFSILDFYDAGTRALGQELMDATSRQWANPNIRKSFITEVAAEVKAIAKGYDESITTISNNRVGDLI